MPQKTIICIGPLPPPFHGAAKNTKIVADDLAALGHRVELIGTNTALGSAHNRSFKYHLARCALAARNAWRLARVSGKEVSVYMVPDGGLGLLYNLLYALIIRLSGARTIWLHHRNMSAIGGGSGLLRALCWMFGAKACHVFLDDGMRAAFEANIRPAHTFRIITNAATCDVDVEASQKLRAARSPGTPPTIGFLSNLNNDKGFDIVANAFAQIAEAHPHVKFAIAGSPTDDEAKSRLETLEGALGARLTTWGQVGGERKEAFFASIDIFVFPSTYRLEAQPNVLFEAMAAGNLMVSTRHACIPAALEGTHHQLIDLAERGAMASALSASVETLLKTYDTPAAMMRVNAENTAHFSAMRATSLATYRSFLERDLPGNTG